MKEHLKEANSSQEQFQAKELQFKEEIEQLKLRENEEKQKLKAQINQEKKLTEEVNKRVKISIIIQVKNTDIL